MSPKTAPVRARSGRVWPVAVSVAGLAVLAYANSLGNGFVWDDSIILNRQLVVFDSVGAVLIPPRDIPQFSPDYYRPVTVASYLLDRSFGGTEPFAYHLSVVLEHAVAAALLAALAWQLLGRTAAGAFGALVAGALFALHPIHTESVAWAAGRADVLAACFLLAALVVHGGGAWTWRRSLATGLLAAGALGAKESAISLYPLLVLRDGLVGERPLRGRSSVEWLRAYGGVVVAAVVYMALRRRTLGEFVGSAPGEAAPGSVLPELIGGVGTYVGKLLWPVQLNAYIDVVPTGPGQIALAGLFCLSVAAAAWWWWRWAEGMPLFALLWIALTLLPSLAIVWKIPAAALAERYLYIPSAGLCLLAGYGAARAWQAWPAISVRSALAALVALALIAMAVGTVQRNRVWRDDLSLWSDTAHKSRVSGMALRGLGTAYQQRGRLVEARSAFEGALARRNTPRGLQIIYNNLGTIAMHEGDLTAARRNYEQALAANPQAADTLFNLGLAVLHGGGKSPAAARQALTHLRRAHDLNPHDADIEVALGQAYSITGEKARAARHLRRALEIGIQPETARGVRKLLQALDGEL